MVRVILSKWNPVIWVTRTILLAFFVVLFLVPEYARGSAVFLTLISSGAGLFILIGIIQDRKLLREEPKLLLFVGYAIVGWCILEIWEDTPNTVYMAYAVLPIYYLGLLMQGISGDDLPF